jgi:hypothetical protein
MVVLISDLLDEPEAIVRGLKHLRFAGSDVIVFHVLDPDELTFPFREPARFKDMESDAEFLVSPTAVRTAYLARLQEMLDTYSRELRGAGIDYVQLDTSKPLDTALLAYLSSRSKRI